MRLIRKGIYYFRSHGLGPTVRQVWDKCDRKLKLLPSACRERVEERKHIEWLKEKINGKKVYIMIPCIDWSLPLFQRPHQIATVLSKMEDSIVLFLSDQYRYDNFCFYRQISETLYLYSIRTVSSLDEILTGSAVVTTIMYWPTHSGLLSKFRYDKLLYEYVDEMQLLYYHDNEMENRHRALMREADLTVVTAGKLYYNAMPYARKLLLCPNAADYEFFKRWRGTPINQKISKIVKEYRCVLGYYGSLAQWFDYDMVLEVAKRKNDWLFVLVGYDFDGTLSRLNQSPLPNILHVEAQPYEELPSFVSGFDIQIIPFVLNDITESTSPVKLFEYMASRKPILTSDMPECRKYKSVIRYDNTDDFIAKASELFESRHDPDYLALLDREAAANTWQARVARIVSELEE